MNKTVENKKSQEIEDLKKKIVDLENKLTALSETNKKIFINRLPRVEMCADIEAIGDFDILKAKGIEISEGGISFEMEEDLPFELQFFLKDQLFKQRVHLVWLEKKQEGGYRCGFRFVEKDKKTEF